MTQPTLSELMDQERREHHLAETNRMFCYNKQSPDIADEHLAQMGHPWAAAYGQLRVFFDGLRYASNAGARWFSYKDIHESAQYHAPGLRLSWYPDGSGLEFTENYPPAQVGWCDYIDAVAAAGWPDETKPSLNGGSWLIRTKQQDLHDTLKTLVDKYCKPGSFNGYLRMETVNGYYEIMLTPTDDLTPTLNGVIIALLKKYHEGFVVPTGPAPVEPPQPEFLPMADRRVILGNVKQLTVTGIAVVVPLIAPGDDAKVAYAVKMFVSLFTSGYPFENAEPWLKKYAAADTFNALKTKFGKSVTE